MKNIAKEISAHVTCRKERLICPTSETRFFFLEEGNIIEDYFSYEFDRNLQSLLQTDGTDTIKGIVFGRFDESCGLTAETIAILSG